MKCGISISIGITFILAFSFGPPDLMSKLTLGVESTGICGLIICVITRFKSYHQMPMSMKRLMLGLICLLSVIGVNWLTLILAVQ